MSKKSMPVWMVTFPTSKVELDPLRKRAMTVVVAIEARSQVDNLDNNWFGQCIIGAGAIVSGKSIASYEEAAKVVAEDIEKLKKEVFVVIGEREADAKKNKAGPDLAEELGKITALKAKVDNSMKSAKSVLRNAVLYGENVIKVVKDGGHILWRADGTPRGKTELQDLIKQAKAYGVAPKSDYEKAMESAFTFAKRLAVLDGEDRQAILGAFHDALADRIAEESGEPSESESEDTLLEEAA